MNHYSVKLNRAACDAKLNAMKSALVSAYPDYVAIPRAAHRRLSKVSPVHGFSDDVQPVERHSRLRTPRPIRITVAEFDAADRAFTAAQVDGARLATGWNPVADLELFTGSVRVVNHYALKLNRAACDTKLNALKSALASAYPDSVIIPLAIDRGLSKIDPTLGDLSKGRLADAHQQE
jgi:hypothetical protein